MNKKHKEKTKRTLGQRLARLLTVLVALVLAAVSSMVAMTVLGVPWESWLTERANGVLAYIELEDTLLDGSVVSVGVSETDVFIVEWTGYQNASVSGSDISLMSEPNGRSAVLCDMKSSSPVKIIAQKGNWYQLRYHSYTGWVPLIFLKPDGERTVFTDTSHDIHDAPEPVEVSSADIPSIEDGELKNYLAWVSKDYGAVGVQAAVIKNGEVAYTFEYGLADKPSGTPIVADTKIRVASLTKVFVAMTAELMQEQGILSLDDDISDLLGDKVGNPSYDTPITLRMLLTHTSSMEDFSITNSSRDWMLNSCRQKRNYFKVTPGDGRGWKYSNAGLCLAGMTLESASGDTLVDYTDRYFFESMGIDASLHPTHIKQPELISTLHKDGEKYLSVKQQLKRPYSQTAGENFRLYAGDLTISAKDLAKLICILIGDGVFEDIYYMSPESVKELETPYCYPPNNRFAQCLGLRYREGYINGRNLYYHTGNANGTLSFFAYDKENKEGVVVITTGCRKGGSVQGIYTPCYRIADRCFSEMREQG